MSGRPLVTVLMAVYNDLPFLSPAVESVLAQSFKNLEFLIVEDGSSDGCAEYLGALRDPRVRVLRNQGNLGLTRSLNHGLDAARGQFIARMDADDICEPHRLERQVQFLRDNPNVGIVGSSRILIDEAGREVAFAPAAESDLAIRWKCLLGNPFAHPTVMLRREVFEAHGLRYDESFRTAQDYELWTRLLSHTCAANLAEPLLRYRLRAGVSRLNKAEQLANHDRIALSAIRRLVPGIEIDLDDVRELRGRFGGFSVREPNMAVDDPHSVARYAALYHAFVQAHRTQPNIEQWADEQRKRIGVKLDAA